LNSYDKLKNIAGVGKPEEDLSRNADELYAVSLDNKSQKFIEDNSNLDPKELYTLWNLNIGTEDFKNSNPTAYHAQREALHPSGQAAAREEYLGSLREELSGLSFSSKETLLRNKARQLPPYAWPLLDHAGNLQQREDSKLIDRNNQLNYFTHESIFAEKDFKDVDTDVSYETHLKDLMNAVDAGLAEVVTVKDGRLSVPNTQLEGGYQPLYTMSSSPDISLSQLKMNREYIQPLARRSIENGYEQALETKKKTESDTLNLLYNNLEGAYLPEDFIYSTIIDRDSELENGAELSIRRLGDVLSNRTPRYSSFTEMTADYKKLVLGLKDRTQRRLDHG